jgi:cytochrome c oxidase assembly protein subunit 15
MRVPMTVSGPSHHELATWLNRFAWFTAAATLFLIWSGGLVTSKGVGLAVPDWPTTFGYNMFLFPVSQWVGGIFFEHTHRLIASTVGFLTIILALWIWRIENRKWLRILGFIALGRCFAGGPRRFARDDVKR